MNPRLPDPQELLPELGAVSRALFGAVGNGSVPQTTISLVHLRAGQLVGSTYLAIRHSSALRRAGEPEERIAAVATWRDAPYFSAAERAALALVEAVFQPSVQGERVPDTLYEQVAEHYEPRALATLIAAIGQVGFFVPVALIARPAPESGPGSAAA